MGSYAVYHRTVPVLSLSVLCVPCWLLSSLEVHSSLKAQKPLSLSRWDSCETVHELTAETSPDHPVQTETVCLPRAEFSPVSVSFSRRTEIIGFCVTSPRSG